MQNSQDAEFRSQSLEFRILRIISHESDFKSCEPESRISVSESSLQFGMSEEAVYFEF
jgi:hypothetical protein